MTEESSNLRVLPVARDDEEALVDKREPADRFCRHDKATIDETSHRLYCQGCGDELDPLDFLTSLVNRWDYVRRERESAQAKSRLVHRELADVERKLKNAKSRLRKKGVLLTTAEARAARDQLRALGRALPNVLREAESVLPVEKAERVAHLCGYRQEDARRALTALTKALDDVGIGAH